MSLARVCWRSRTGMVGRGEPLPLDFVEEWVQVGNEFYRGEVWHWVELVEDEAGDLADATAANGGAT